MDSNAREVAFTQQLVKLRCTLRALDEDDDLVELEGVEQIIQLSILLLLAELEKVLLKSVKGKLRLIVDVDL